MQRNNYCIKMKRKKKPFLARFTKSGFLFRLSGYVARAILFFLSITLRFDIRGIQKLKKLLEAPDRPPIIIALWHNQFLLLAPILKKTLAAYTFTILMSKSRDGEIPAAFAQTYPQVEVVRAGHKSRHHALLQMVHALSNGRIIIVTPDGPRGPVYSVKPGTIYLAQKTGALIYPMSWQATKRKQLNTWDKFCIPRPFSKITATFGEPILCKEGEDMQLAAARLKSAMPSA